MVPTQTCRSMDVPTAIKQLEKERGEEVLKISRELSDVIQGYDTRIGLLNQVLCLRKEGKSLPREQYKHVAKQFCSRYWINDGGEIRPELPICSNCGPGAIEDCVTYGDSTIAGKLVL